MSAEPEGFKWTGFVKSANQAENTLGTEVKVNKNITIFIPHEKVSPIKKITESA